MAISNERAHRAWRNAERIKRLSDRLVGVGPFSIGLDGVLSWVPIAGTVYSIGAGLLLMVEGIAGQASIITLARMLAYLTLNTLSSLPLDVGVPVVGSLLDTLFQGHLMAANALQKDIERRHGPSELPASWGGKKKGARKIWPAASPGRR